jgi:hypothetical protein
MEVISARRGFIDICIILAQYGPKHQYLIFLFISTAGVASAANIVIIGGLTVNPSTISHHSYFKGPNVLFVNHVKSEYKYIDMY